MHKRDWQPLPNGSPERVVAHAEWAAERGRGPSMAYKDIRDPRKALVEAKKDWNLAAPVVKETAPKVSLEGGLIIVKDVVNSIPEPPTSSLLALGKFGSMFFGGSNRLFGFDVFPERLPEIEFRGIGPAGEPVVGCFDFVDPSPLSSDIFREAAEEPNLAQEQPKPDQDGGPG